MFKEETNLEKIMGELVNEDRKKYGLHNLVYNLALSNVARTHSIDMATNNFFEHLSPTTGEPQDRISSAGIWFSKSAENIAVNTDVLSAEKGLMNSPGHRANILDPEFTEIGIGIISNENGQLYITQNFIKAIPKIKVKYEELRLLRIINEKRKTKGLPFVKSNPTLVMIAKKNSNRMKEQNKTSTEEVINELEVSTVSYTNSKVWVGSVYNSDELLNFTSLYEKEFSQIGIGLVQDMKNGRIWETVVLIKI